MTLMGRRRQSVTITHVAADAGICRQTVSRAFCDEPGFYPANTGTVQTSVNKLDYVRSISARRISGWRSYPILALDA
ncbi:hypothetical protein [Qipengyuania qiaonensis]|uniref:LacI family DNA-binding transcriptional regulator n=1 Tax=Qipengyuania qiaonensis TaxID=2867240 RepID=A0ABS7JA15_9SPHN|nr:hypothetical protein [Qipengyuania qiaonensis]MBX7484165.1 hypothetical protein [Qipengyuania qiaonensis]